MSITNASVDLDTHRLGTVVLEPNGPVVAGEMGQWTLTYTVGSYGVDEGGTIKLSQRFASDWQVPQFDQPQAAGYTTVTTNGNAKLRPYYHTKAHERPWMKCLVIDVYDGSLLPGDTVTITLGDRRQGSPGSRAQTFQESAHEFRLLIDPTNASVARRLPTSPVIPVVSGAATALICVVPSQADVGKSVPIFVRGQDIWGNPTPAPENVHLVWMGEADAEIEGDTLVCRTPGVGWIEVSAETKAGKLTARSNPVEALPANALTPRYYWGDLHAQTAGTVGTGSEEEYFAFGRDVARLDFTSHQGNDFQMDDDYWRHLNHVVAKFHEDGHFVVFPGYEWSANTPAGGDRNVIYREEGQPIFRSSHWQIPHVPEDELSPAHPARALFDRIRQHVDVDKVLLGAHVGGRYADIRHDFDEELGPLVEVVSCWGVFEWMLWDAFDQGYVVGVMCNSDGHKGRPGAEGPGAGDFGIAGGLTCVMATELTREAIFAALKARRCYGTSGPRMGLRFNIDGHPMGSVIKGTDMAHVEAEIMGTAPLESLMLFQGKQPLEIVRPSTFSSAQGSRRVRVSWRGSRMRGRGRRAVWDGEIRVEGALVDAAATVAFDSSSNGIVEQTAQRVVFTSATTGDMDGIDLWLDESEGGQLTFVSNIGTCTVELAELQRIGSHQEFDFGGLDMAVRVERYPEEVSDYILRLACIVKPPHNQRTPYFVKATQIDGHVAWSSPIYIGDPA